MWSFPLIIVICACIQTIFSIISHMNNPITNKVDNNILENSIFVCMVSYKDNHWVDDIVNILNSSTCFHRVFIGIVEYIEKDSISEQIPSKFRNNIRVKTVSSKTASFLSNGRKTCFNNLYRNEKYVLFSKSTQLCNAWDDILINYVRERSDIVISTKLENSTENKFLKIDSAENPNLLLGSRKMCSTHYMRSVPSVLWCEDFSFSKGDIAHMLFSNEHYLEIAAILFHNNIKCHHPGICIGRRAQHPVGLRSKSKFSMVNKKNILSFTKSIGINLETNHVSPQLRCGLTLYPNSEECIAKYGSTWQANLMIENQK